MPPPASALNPRSGEPCTPETHAQLRRSPIPRPHAAPDHAFKPTFRARSVPEIGPQTDAACMDGIDLPGRDDLAPVAEHAPACDEIAGPKIFKPHVAFEFVEGDSLERHSLGRKMFLLCSCCDIGQSNPAPAQGATRCAHQLSPLSAFFWLRRPPLAQPRSPARRRSSMATPSKSTRSASGSLASTRLNPHSSARPPRRWSGAVAKPLPSPWPISSAGRRSSAPSTAKTVMAGPFPAAIAAMLKSTPGWSRTDGPLATMMILAPIHGCSGVQPQLVAGSGRDLFSALATGDDSTNDLLATNRL